MPEILKFPMRVKAFLALQAPEIQRGDVILSQSPIFSSHIIRWATGSLFSHAALMFLVPHVEEGFENAFLLESTSAGVGIANLDSYVGGRHPHAAIAILRLEGKGFDEAFFKKVRGLMLDHVQSGYDYGRMMQVGLSAIFGLKLTLSRARRGSANSMRDAVKRTRRKWLPPQFFCSGFIQYGFAEAMHRDGRNADAVLFRSDIDSHDREALLAVTPQDIATSPKLTWRYVIRRGWVYPVSSYEEARKIISSAR